MLDINRDKEYLSVLKFQLILCVLHLCGYSLVTQFRAFSLFVCFKGAVLVFWCIDYILFFFQESPEFAVVKLCLG